MLRCSCILCSARRQRFMTVHRFSPMARIRISTNYDSFWTQCLALGFQVSDWAKDTALKENIHTLTTKALLKHSYFERRLNTLEVTQKPWTLISKQIWSRSFKWGTKHWFGLRGCKDIRGQSWRLKEISADQPGSSPCAWGQLSWQILFSTSNFDLWYLCSF